MPTKSALVLGICEYDDEKLKRLHCPDTDVKELAQVLKDSALGGFDAVVPCVNEGKAGAEKAISRLFAEKGREDLVVLYFSGHGLRDDENELYLAVKDTDSRDLDGTAIAAAYIKRVMNKSNSRRQVLILDCCHSGAFATGFKGAEVLGASVGTKAAFDTDGFGRVILTASDATQYAWESERVVGESQTSLYTSFLIEGIRTGAADLSRDGMITVNELHEYVYARTLASSSKQRPTKICDKEQGALILSRAPLHAVTLPQEVEGALKSTLSSVRMAAIEELVQMFEHQCAGLALSAHQALAALRLDDSAKVRAAAEAAMLGCAGKRPDIKPELLNAIAVASDGKVEDSERVRALREKQAAAVETLSVPLLRVDPTQEHGGTEPLKNDVQQSFEEKDFRIGKFRHDAALKRLKDTTSATGNGGKDAVQPKRRMPLWAKAVVGVLGLLLTIRIIGTIYYMSHPVPAPVVSFEKNAGDAAVDKVGTPSITSNFGNSKSDGKKGLNAGVGMLEACVFDPVSNVRTLATDSSGIACTINTVRTITVHATPLLVGKGEWWRTEVCGTTGFIAGNQVHVRAACP